MRLPWSASTTGIQCHFTPVSFSDQRTTVKSRVPAMLSTVSKFEICPTQLDCEINRIRLKLHELYATVPLTSQAVHFRVPLSTRILVHRKEKTLLVTRGCEHKVDMSLSRKKPSHVHAHDSFPCCIILQLACTSQNACEYFRPLNCIVSAPAYFAISIF